MFQSRHKVYSLTLGGLLAFLFMALGLAIIQIHNMGNKIVSLEKQQKEMIAGLINHKQALDAMGKALSGRKNP